MKKILLLTAIIFYTSFVFAATGWYQDYVKINVNGSGTSAPTGWYWIGNDPSYATQLDGAALGNVHSLIIDGCDMKYWSDNQDRTGGAFYYKIMSSNGTTEIVSPVEIIWDHNYLGGNDYQGLIDTSIDLLENLVPGTSYQLHIWSKSWGSSQGDSWLNNGGNNYVATFTFQQTTYSSTGNWSVGTNWNYGKPNEGSYAVIDGSVSVDEEASVKNLTINTTKSLTINTSQTINFYGNLTNNGTITNNGNIVLKSTAEGTASMITSGTFTDNGEITIERYLSQDIYHYISSPVNYPQGNSSYYFDQLSLGLASGDNFRRYETSTNTWIDILNGPDGTYGNSDDLMDEETFQQGMGYAIAYEGENKTLSFTGSPNNGSISVAVSSGGVGNNSGANFIGNPYPSTVQASSFISDNSAILSGKLYFWDEPSSEDFGKSDYATRTSSAGNPGGGGNSPTDFIDPGQGFFVVAESNGNVTFENSQRVHGSSVFFKNENVIKDFKLSVKNLETKDQNTITVVFDENSSEGFDKLYDAPKWQGNPDLALYTFLGDKKLAINSLPELINPVMVKVGLKAQNTGVYKFSVHTIDNFDPDTPITLEDRLTGDQVDLTETPEYNFSVSEPGTFDDRFVLYFKSAVGMDEIEHVNQPHITLQNNQLRIENLDAGDYRLRITDLTGRTVLVGDFAAEQTYGLPVSLKTGIYIVEIVTENHIFADKLFVQ